MIDPYILGWIGSFAMAPRANGDWFLKLSLVARGLAPVRTRPSRHKIRFSTIGPKPLTRAHRPPIDAETMQDVPEQKWVERLCAADWHQVAAENADALEIARLGS